MRPKSDRRKHKRLKEKKSENKEHLKKALARVEDLEEQLRIKNVSER